MRVLEDLKIGNADKYLVDMFNSLPDKAKEVMFASIKRLSFDNPEYLKDYFSYIMGDYSSCKSPIEKILFVALDFVYLLRSCELPMLDEITPQYEINDGEKTYFVDLFLLLESKEFIKIAVECDGYEFHQKTKQQVKHDNEREMRIKLLGYDVLRFSGTQIYENPIKCANDIFDYVLTKIN